VKNLLLILVLLGGCVDARLPRSDSAYECPKCGRVWRDLSGGETDYCLRCDGAPDGYVWAKNNYWTEPRKDRIDPAGELDL